jgi:hypothetical protein
MPNPPVPAAASDSFPARVEVLPVEQLRAGDRAIITGGTYAPDVRDAAQTLADAGAGMRVLRCVVNGAVCTLDVAGRRPMAYPVGTLAYAVLLRSAPPPAAPPETRLELDPDAGQPAEPDDLAGYCAEPECTAPATDGGLCGFHAQAARDAEGGAA